MTESNPVIQALHDNCGGRAKILAGPQEFIARITKVDGDAVYMVSGREETVNITLLLDAVDAVLVYTENDKSESFK